MNYSELLKSEKWKNKRTEILKRDEQICQRCGIESSTTVIYCIKEIDEKIEWKKIGDTLNPSIKIVKFHYNGMEVFCKTKNSYQYSFSKGESLLIFHLGKKNKLKYPYSSAVINNVKFSIFDEINYQTKQFPEFLREKLKLKYDVDFEKDDIDFHSFYLAKKDDAKEFIKNSNLHVHHKCYRKGKEIWNQKNSEYESLCNICHKIVHENQLIPFYDEDGINYHTTKPCRRCGGLRYFGEYKHINNGICFGCNGKGYQQDLTKLLTELMKKNGSE